MDMDAITYFKDREVKITLRNGFTLYGKILTVYIDSIFFKTEQNESLISLDEITTVVGR